MMKENFQIEQIFRFWRAIEALMPQKAEKTNPTDPHTPVYPLEDSEALFPWAHPGHCRKPLGKGKAWRYTLQCGLYDTNKLANLLEDKIGAHEEVFDDRRDGGRSRLFDLRFNDNGYPIPETFVLSLACWSAGQILHFDGGVEILERGGQIDTQALQRADDSIPNPNQ